MKNAFRNTVSSDKLRGLPTRKQVTCLLILTVVVAALFATPTVSFASSNLRNGSSQSQIYHRSLTQTVPLTAIRMLDRSKGWALTAHNILFTSNGGQNWKDVTPSGSLYSQYAVGDFMNDKYAWIASTAQMFENDGVNVLHTSDGGQHWQSSKISLSNVSVLDYPHFLTIEQGFLELGQSGKDGEVGLLFHTKDGGQNWSDISGSIKSSCTVPVVVNANKVSSKTVPCTLPYTDPGSGISFKDVSNGWATGETSSTPLLYVTHNGGQIWNKQLLQVPQDSKPSTDPFPTRYTTTPPIFFGNNGFLPVQKIEGSGHGEEDYHLLIYKSTNGGATWVSPTLLPSYGEKDLYIESAHNAWVTDESGNVYGIDANGNWSELASKVDATIKALSFVDASYGWAIGDSKLWHTTDGGRTWQQITYSIQ